MRVASIVSAACLTLGCLLHAAPAFPHAQPTTTVQFDREIVHVLDDHCVMCHEEKGLAFPLFTYEQTYAARWQIRQDALDRHMSPWAAVPGYGEFDNDNGLTQREIDFLVSWAESYGPRNNGEVYTGIAAAPAAPKVVQAHFDFSRWTLGSPDLRLTLPANTIPPMQSDTVERATLDPRLSVDRWLRAVEYKPGDRRVVHAVSFTIAESGQWIGSWTPWYGFASLPRGLAYRLAAGVHILAEIHYYGSNEPVADQGSLGLYFTEQPSARAVADIVVDAKAMPTTGPSRKLLGTKRLEADTNVLALRPQLGRGIESIEISARMPDGAARVLLFARAVPLEWPTPYVLKRAVSLPKGTELSVIEHYGGEASIPAGGYPVTLTVYAGAHLESDEPRVQPASAVTQRFKLTGVIKAIDSADGRVIVQHGAIPGLMDAMTMTYSVRAPEDLRSLKAGDEIRSDVVVSATGTYLEHIEVVRSDRTRR